MIIFLERIKYLLKIVRLTYDNTNSNFDILRKNKTVYIDPAFKISNCTFGGFNSFFDFGWASNTNFASYTYVQYGANISNANIGKFCSIGPFVMIAHGEHPLNFISTNPVFFSPPYRAGLSEFTKSTFFESHKIVNIGSDVWIGANCYIKDGITVGHGAVIGAGAVVTKDVPPYAIVGGVPAKVLKYRFDETEIKKLLELKWWDWETDKILRNIKLFQQPLEAINLDNL